MFCMKCGGQLDNDSRFCPVCGTPVEGEVKDTAPVDNAAPVNTAASTAQVNKPAPKVKAPKPAGKKSFVGIIVLAVVVLLIGGGAALYFTNPVVKAKAAIKNEKMKDLEKAYKSANGNSQERIQDLAYIYFEGVYQQYADDTGDVDWDDMEDLYDDLSKKVLKKYDDFEDLWEEATELNESRSNYEMAKECYDDGNYFGCMDLLKKVSKDDAPYQEKVKDLMDKAETGYVGDVELNIDLFISEGSYDTAYSFINDASTVISDDSKLEPLREKVNDAYIDGMYESVDEYLEWGWYEDALDLLDRAYEQSKDEGVLEKKELVSSQIKALRIDEAREDIYYGYFNSGFYIINDLIEEYGEDDADISALRTEAGDIYRTNLLPEVQDYMDRGYYYYALQILYEMDENLPNDEIIQIYIQTCEENY